MKSKSMIAKWVGALLGGCLLLGAGVAQAAVPICYSILPATMNVVVGSASAELVATCDGTPTAYVWKVGATTVTSCTGATCIIPAAKLTAMGANTVTVTANNGSGPGTVSASATVTVTPVPSDCLPTYGPVDYIDPQVPATGQKVTLTANCNPGVNRSTTVDGYVWTAGGSPIPGADLVSATATAPVITVKIPAEGTQYAVTNNTTVNSAKSPGAFYSGAPDCTLESVSPTVSGAAVTINPGASAVLLPTCDAATSIDWYIDIPNGADIDIPAPAGGAVSPAATTAYYVVGNNGYGSSGSNVVTVTVNPPAPALPAIPAPLCSLTASPLTISVGGSTTLTATCPGATSFTWTGSGAPATSTTSTIAVTPTSPGAKTYTVTGTNGSGTSAAASVIVNVSALPLSACTVIAPATVAVTVNSASPVLSATCDNTPTAWVWKLNNAAIPGCATNASTCTVPATSLSTVGGAYTVTVTANNAGGTGITAASRTITVNALPLSACTAIAPATVSVVRGSASPVLSATCDNTPTAWVWKLNNAAIPGCATNASTCTVPATSIPTAGASYTVTVTANNAGGTGTQAASRVITVTSVAVPSCTAIAPTTVSVTVGSASPALSATCSNTPTAWVWRLNGAAITGCATNASTCTVPAASLPTVGGAYTVTVTANNTGGAGVVAASRVITVSSAAPISCPQTWISEKVFDFNLSGQTQFMTVKRGQASAMKFTTGSDLTKKGSIATSASPYGPETAKFMNISTSKCDFNYANLSNNSYCAATRTLSTTLAYTLGAAAVGRCKLQPNTTYYVNIRNEDARLTTTRGIDTCVGTSSCSFGAVLGN